MNRKKGRKWKSLTKKVAVVACRSWKVTGRAGRTVDRWALRILVFYQLTDFIDYQGFLLS